MFIKQQIMRQKLSKKKIENNELVNKYSKNTDSYAFWYFG